ncbi:MAG: proton-conducting transporter membrane subunit [Clostridiaceae bacterium]
MHLYIMIAVFIAAMLVSAKFKNINIISYVNIGALSLLLIIIFIKTIEIVTNGPLYYFGNVVYIDSLSQIQLIIVASVSFLTALYSHKYILGEYEEKLISLNKARVYFLSFQIFVSSMIFICISNNIMGMWIGLEATTLSTAFLIGFNNSKLSLEAAWKYIIICSVGLVIGLIGIILFIYSMNAEINTSMLQWTYLQNWNGGFDKQILIAAFTFIFIGIGTKAGIAPMHTWLSDGHSEAPSPISAMMSGILINLALYVIVRFYIIIRMVNGIENIRYLFIVFGCISLIISTFSILKQTNYKRLLAFSSVENIGIMSLGFGFGGLLGVYGSLLHSIVHAYGKSLLFLVSGNILNAYKTKRIGNIKGLIKTMPYNSVFLIIGILVITGTPPAASFFSELKILQSGFNNGNYVSVAILAVCLIIAFAGFIVPFIKMIFSYDSTEYQRNDKDKENMLPLIIAVAFIIIISCTFNNLLNPLLNDAANIVCGLEVRQ